MYKDKIKNYEQYLEYQRNYKKMHPELDIKAHKAFIEKRRARTNRMKEYRKYFMERG